MSKYLKATLFLWLLATLGCSDWLGGGIDNIVHYDSGPRYDARPPDLSCLGVDIPATAPPLLTMSGITYHPGIPGVTEDEPVPHATIRGYGNGEVRIATSDAEGLFSLEGESNGVPIDGYLEVTQANYFLTVVHSPTPLYEDLDDLEIPLVNDDDVELLSTKIEIDADTTKGFVGIEVVDCELLPLAGVIVTFTPPVGSIIYNDITGYPNLNSTSTGPDGIAFLFNIPPGELEVDGEIGGESLREVTIPVAAIDDDRFTVTRISP